MLDGVLLLEQRLHADVKLPGRLEPGGLKRHLHPHRRPDERPLLVLRLHEQIEKQVDLRLEAEEAASEIVVIVLRQVGRPAASPEDRELADDSRHLEIRRQGMDALGVGDDVEDGVRLVQLAKLMQQERVPLADAVEGDAAADELGRDQVDLLADAFVDRLQDAALQRLPRLAGEDRREPAAINLGKRLGPRRLFQPGERQHVVAVELLGREEKLDVESADLDLLRVDAVVLVLQLLGRDAEAGRRGRVDGRVRLAEGEDRQREIDRHQSAIRN